MHLGEDSRRLAKAANRGICRQLPGNRTVRSKLPAGKSATPELRSLAGEFPVQPLVPFHCSSMPRWTAQPLSSKKVDLLAGREVAGVAADQGRGALQSRGRLQLVPHRKVILAAPAVLWPEPRFAHALKLQPARRQSTRGSNGPHTRIRVFGFA